MTKGDVVHIYNNTTQPKEKKKNEIMPLAAIQMDLEIIILSAVSETEKDKYHIVSSICGI